MSIALEQAISMAKAEAFLDNDGDSIVIDRSKQTSRKRNREKEETEVTAKSRSGKIEDIEFWKQKYFEVKKLRDEAEEDLEQQIVLSKEREAVHENYSKLLLKKINDSDQKHLVSKKNFKDNEALENSELQKLLTFYELLTSTSIRIEDDGKFVCTVKNKVTRNATRFTIEGTNAHDLDYVPKANITLLPPYLKSSISFERNMAPVLLADIILALNETES